MNRKPGDLVYLIKGNPGEFQFKKISDSNDVVYTGSLYNVQPITKQFASSEFSWNEFATSIFGNFILNEIPLYFKCKKYKNGVSYGTLLLTKDGESVSEILVKLQLAVYQRPPDLLNRNVIETDGNEIEDDENRDQDELGGKNGCPAIMQEDYQIDNNTNSKNQFVAKDNLNDTQNECNNVVDTKDENNNNGSRYRNLVKLIKGCSIDWGQNDNSKEKKIEEIESRHQKDKWAGPLECIVENPNAKSENNGLKKIESIEIEPDERLNEATNECNSDTEIQSEIFSNILTCIRAQEISVQIPHGLSGPVFVCSRQIPEPIETCDIFCNRATNYLQKIRKPFPLQSVAWSQIYSKRSIIMVTDTTNLAEWVYLPPICSAISEYKSQSARGPKVIIFCSSYDQVVKLRERCCYLLPKNKAFFIKDMSNNNKETYQAYDILVASVNCIGMLFRDSSTSLKCVVFEDVPEAKLVNEVKSWYSQKPKGIQMIITSNRFFPEFWQYHKKDGELMLLLKSLDGKRSLNHSGTFNIINCAPNRKDEKLFQILPNWKHQKSIIVCADKDEVTKLTNQFRNTPQLLTGATNVETWQENIRICSDESLESLSFNGVDHIIHYSLPPDLIAFIERISNIQFEKIGNSVIKMNHKVVPSTILSVPSEAGPSEMFLVGQMISQFSASIEDDHRNAVVKHLQRMNQEAELCPSIIDYNDVEHLIECNKRHFVHNVDQININLFIPYKLEVLKVHSPIHYSVRLLQKEQQPYNGSERFLKFETTFNEYYSKKFLPIKNEQEIKIGALCTYESGGKYYRCRVLKKERDGDQIHFHVKKIDFDEEVVTDRSHIAEMFSLYSEYPAQAATLIILNRVPKFNNWSRSNVKVLKNFVNNAVERQNLFQTDLFLQINDILFVNHIKDSEYSGRWSQLLIRKNIAKADTTAATNFFNSIKQLHSLYFSDRFQRFFKALNRDN